MIEVALVAGAEWEMVERDLPDPDGPPMPTRMHVIMLYQPRNGAGSRGID